MLGFQDLDCVNMLLLLSLCRIHPVTSYTVSYSDQEPNCSGTLLRHNLGLATQRVKVLDLSS